MDNSGVRVDYENALINAGFGKFHFYLLIVCGMIYMNTAIGITIISFVLPSATCDFRMSSSDKGLLTAAPMLGEFKRKPKFHFVYWCMDILLEQACLWAVISGAVWLIQKAEKSFWLPHYFWMGCAAFCHQWHNTIASLCSFAFSMDLGELHCIKFSYGFI